MNRANNSAMPYTGFQITIFTVCQTEQADCLVEAAQIIPLDSAPCVGSRGVDPWQVQSAHLDPLGGVAVRELVPALGVVSDGPDGPPEEALADVGHHPPVHAVP